MKPKKPIEENGSDSTSTFRDSKHPTGESVLDPSVFEVRLTGRKDLIDEESELLKGRGFIASGSRKMMEPDMHRTYLVKKATVEEDDNTAEQVAKVTAAENELGKLKSRIKGELMRLAKAEEGLATMPGDAEHVGVRALQRNLIDRIRFDIRGEQIRLQHLEATVSLSAGLLERQKRKARTQEVLAMLPKIPCQRCEKVGGLKPAVGIMQPQFACPSRDMGWRDPNIAVWVDAACTECFTRQRVSLNVEVPKTEAEDK